MAVASAASTKQRSLAPTNMRSKTLSASAGKYQASTGTSDATQFTKCARRREFLGKSCFRQLGDGTGVVAPMSLYRFCIGSAPPPPSVKVCQLQPPTVVSVRINKIQLLL